MKLSDIATGSSAFKSKFVLNTVKHDKPIIPKFILEEIEQRKKQILKSLELNGMESDPISGRVRYKK